MKLNAVWKSHKKYKVFLLIFSKIFVEYPLMTSVPLEKNKVFKFAVKSGNYCILFDLIIL